MIAHNATLREITSPPATPEALAAVSGFGPRGKVEKYGEEILALVAEG